MDLAPVSPQPRAVMSADGIRLATYEFGEDPDAPVAVLVHGFASSAIANWVHTGWVRELDRAGYRVIAYDQRGHGASEKPHHKSNYSMEILVADLMSVMDTYLLDEVVLVGYSLGARVGWHGALDLPTRITRAVLGGIPAGDPLTRFLLAEARRYIADRTPTGDRLTSTYLTMAESIKDNDLTALIDLVEGMRGGTQSDPTNPPGQPLLFATGSEDPIMDGSRLLAASAPNGEFFEIPGRNHFNAPTAKLFRDRALSFLGPATS